MVGEDIGFERRLLETVRWTVSTAVASPQRSESVPSTLCTVGGRFFCLEGDGFEPIQMQLSGGQLLDAGSTASTPYVVPLGNNGNRIRPPCFDLYKSFKIVFSLSGISKTGGYLTMYPEGTSAANPSSLASSSTNTLWPIGAKIPPCASLGRDDNSGSCIIDHTICRIRTVFNPVLHSENGAFSITTSHTSS